MWSAALYNLWQRVEGESSRLIETTYKGNINQIILVTVINISPR